MENIGELQVLLSANLDALNKGLGDAEQAVKKADAKLNDLGKDMGAGAQQAADATKQASSSLDKLDEMSSKIGASFNKALGPLLLITAALQGIQALGTGFRAFNDELDKSGDYLDAAEKGIVAFTDSLPLVGDAYRLLRDTGIAFGLIADEAKEAADAAEEAAKQQAGYAASANAVLSIKQNEIDLLREAGDILAADLKQAEMQAEAIRQQAREHRAAAKEMKSGGQILRNQAAELEKQADLIEAARKATARKAEEERRSVELLAEQAKIQETLQKASDASISANAQANQISESDLKIKQLELDLINARTAAEERSIQARIDEEKISSDLVEREKEIAFERQKALSLLRDYTGSDAAQRRAQVDARFAEALDEARKAAELEREKVAAKRRKAEEQERKKAEEERAKERKAEQDKIKSIREALALTEGASTALGEFKFGDIDPSLGLTPQQIKLDKSQDDPVAVATSGINQAASSVTVPQGTTGGMTSEVSTVELTTLAKARNAILESMLSLMRQGGSGAFT